MRAAVAITAIATVWSLGVGAAAPILHDVSPSANANVGAPVVTVGAPMPAMLGTLSALKPDKISGYLTRNSASIERTMAAGGDARAVTAWWAGLSDGERTLLGHDASAVLGNLNGLPARLRDTINRERVDVRLRALTAQEKTRPRSLTARARAELDRLRQITAALKRAQGGPPRSLISFDPAGAGRAAVVIGDLDTAESVSVLVPGMSYTVAGQLVAWAATAQTVYDEQVAWLQRLRTPSRTVATVAWLGYRTPDLGTVLSPIDAQAGAQRLDELLAGIRALRVGNEPYLSVIAHSYGSTTALYALANGTVRIDALAMVGSPGGPVSSVRQLDVADSQVYVGADAWDPVAGSGFFGPDPSGSGFGAHPIGVGAGIDPLDGNIMLPAIGHNGYFAPGTQSLRNLALIGMGEGALATTP